MLRGGRRRRVTEFTLRAFEKEQSSQDIGDKLKPFQSRIHTGCIQRERTQTHESVLQRIQKGAVFPGHKPKRARFRKGAALPGHDQVSRDFSIPKYTLALFRRRGHRFMNMSCSKFGKEQSSQDIDQDRRYFEKEQSSRTWNTVEAI